MCIPTCTIKARNLYSLTATPGASGTWSIGTSQKMQDAPIIRNWLGSPELSHSQLLFSCLSRLLFGVFRVFCGLNLCGVKPAFQKDNAFIADVRRVLASGASGIWWLGQSGFLIVHRGQAIVLDPYLSDSLTHKYADTDKPHIRLTERVIAPEALAAI